MRIDAGTVPTTIEAQETAMWKEYEAEKARLAHKAARQKAYWLKGTLTSPVPQQEKISETSDSKTKITVKSSRRPHHFYPTSKSGHTSKCRRYQPSVKFTDKGKIHGKKGKPYCQLKAEGIAPDVTV